MADRWSDEHLDLVLGSVGEHLVVPMIGVPSAGVPTVAPRVPVGPVAPPSRFRVLAAAAAAIVVLILVGTTVSPVHEAIADVVEWLDVGSTRIQRVDPGTGDPSGLVPVTAGLPPVTVAEAERVLGRPLPPTTALRLGPPTFVATPPEGGALLAWPDGTTLWVLPTGADPDDPLIEKLLVEFDRVERVPGLGDEGVFVGGNHVLTTPHRRVAADSVVLWTDDGLQLRLESDRAREVMVAMARSLAPSR